MIFIAYLGHIEVKYSSCKFLKNSEGQIHNGTLPLTHSRRDLLNVLNFEYLQLGYILGI